MELSLLAASLKNGHKAISLRSDFCALPTIIGGFRSYLPRFDTPAAVTETLVREPRNWATTFSITQDSSFTRRAATQRQRQEVDKPSSSPTPLAAIHYTCWRHLKPPRCVDHPVDPPAMRLISFRRENECDERGCQAHTDTCELG